SLGMFETALAPGELLTSVRFPAWPRNRRWSVQKFARRRGDFAIARVALTLDLDEDGFCTHAHIVLQGVADRPIVADSAASALLGHRPDVPRLRTAARIASTLGDPGSDLLASAELRVSLSETLTFRALAQAL